MNKYFTALAAAAFAGTTLAAPQLTRTSNFEFGVSNKDGGVAEISAFDPITKKLFTASAQIGGVVVLDYTNPAKPSAVDTITFPSELLGQKRLPNSVAVHGGILAVAVERFDSIPNSTLAMVPRQISGDISLFDIAKPGFPLIASYPVGVLPDMVTFSKDGTKIVSANEAEPTAEYLADSVGSVSVINLSAGAAKGVVTTLNFTKFNADSASLVKSGIVLEGFKGATVAQDLEPEYVAINAEGTKAWVTLQEANALAHVDLAKLEITSITALPKKDLSTVGMGMDLIADGVAKIENFPVTALSMPDGITHFTAAGKGYLLIANEGDGREYGAPYNNEIKVKDVTKLNKWAATMDQTVVAKLPDLVLHAGESSNALGEYDKLVMFGGRSFSVLDESGKLIWDSGDHFEQTIGKLFPAAFNTSHKPNEVKVDDRSPKKGPEPEAVTVGELGGVPYAFIALERIGGIMVYDLSIPTAPSFVQYVNNRDLATAKPVTVGTKDVLGPEGILFVPALQSPTAKALLIVSNEVSGTVETFTFEDNGSSINGNSIRGSSIKIDITRSNCTLTLPESSSLSVKIFGLNGRQIATLHSGILDKGTHSIAMPSNIASGSYLLTVETSTEQRVQKIAF